MAPNLFVRQFTKLPYPEISFKEQTVIITGSNTGLGFEAARHFARLGASKVILAVRSISRGEEAVKSINTSTGTNVCEVWHVNMGDFKSITDFCKRAEGLNRLDVVCQNAGIAKGEFTQMEGMESTIAVNVVGTFLMALNLLPTLRRSGIKTGHVPRLVNTSSEVYESAKMAVRFEDSIFMALNKSDKPDMADRYQTSKLLGVFFIRALVEQIQLGKNANQRVIMNMVNPGLCDSGLTRDATGLQSAFFWLLKKILGRSAEVGSRTLIAGAAAREESHGCYMSECQLRDLSGLIMTDEGHETQKRVYIELIGILEAIQPGISQNI